MLMLSLKTSSEIRTFDAAMSLKKKANNQNKLVKFKHRCWLKSQETILVSVVVNPENTRCKVWIHHGWDANPR